MNLQSQVIYVPKKTILNNVYILEDGASGEQVGEIER